MFVRVVGRTSLLQELSQWSFSRGSSMIETSFVGQNGDRNFCTTAAL